MVKPEPTPVRRGKEAERLHERLKHPKKLTEAQQELYRGCKPTLEVQTRDESGELKFFKTIKEAFAYATQNKEVWKISFSIGEERVRLVRTHVGFVYEPLIQED